MGIFGKQVFKGNEILRSKIKAHVNYEGWVDTLPPQGREIFLAVMEADVTPAVIRAAGKLEHWQTKGFDFLRAIAGGNPGFYVRVDLTNFVLGDILYDIETFGKVEAEDPDE
jgi:hypothetical protein